MVWNPWKSTGIKFPKKILSVIVLLVSLLLVLLFLVLLFFVFILWTAYDCKAISLVPHTHIPDISIIQSQDRQAQAQ